MARFDERDHPRHPRGSSKGGEFRDKFGGDWASIVSGRISAIAGGGSVATGKTAICPGCGRTVKVVGNGVLSTHNVSRGKRCPGSGSAVGAAKVKEPKLDLTKRPPPPPRVGRQGKPLDSVHDSVWGNREASSRMRVWRGGTVSDTRANSVGNIFRAQVLVRTRERELASVQYRPAAIERQVLAAQSALDSAKRSLQVAQDDANLGKPFDPANPLAYYGGRLHIEGDSWHIYNALNVLEQRVPPAFHKAAAEFLHSRHTANPGIYIGDTQMIPEMDDLGHLKGRHPRGWGKGKTYADVDGVVSGGDVMVVVHTANTESHRQSRAAEYAEMPMSYHVDASAALHEFGHLLDSVLAQRKPYGRLEEPSERRLFRLLHGRVKKEAGNRLSPYFRQRGDAGPSEFFADAFGVWTQAESSPWSSPQLPGGMLVGKSHTGMGGGVDRQATWQDVVIARTYRVSVGLAAEVTDYFNRLQRELESGKLLPVTQQVIR